MDRHAAPRPVVDDPDTGGFWTAAGDGHLAILCCEGCGVAIHLPVPRCHRCGSWDATWTPIPGSGRVYSWTVVERQVHPSFPTPFTIVLVELAARPEVRLVGHLPGRAPVEVGTPLRARFETGADGVTVPMWELDEPRGDQGPQLRRRAP